MSQVELEVLSALPDGVPLEDVQVASETLLPTNQVREALVSLEEKGIVQHTGDTGRERYFKVVEAGPTA